MNNENPHSIRERLMLQKTCPVCGSTLEQKQLKIGQSIHDTLNCPKCTYSTYDHTRAWITDEDDEYLWQVSSDMQDDEFPF
jgi:ssDNA-binding Zn-finger/Zn-ribbon topoisomerase 1